MRTGRKRCSRQERGKHPQEPSIAFGLSLPPPLPHTCPVALLMTQQTSTHFQLFLGKVSEGPAWPEGDKSWRRGGSDKWEPFYLCSHTSTSACLGTLLCGLLPPHQQFQTLPLSPVTCIIFVTMEKKKSVLREKYSEREALLSLKRLNLRPTVHPLPPPSEMPRSSEKIQDGTVHLQRSGSRRRLP